MPPLRETQDFRRKNCHSDQSNVLNIFKYDLDIFDDLLKRPSPFTIVKLIHLRFTTSTVNMFKITK